MNRLVTPALVSMDSAMRDRIGGYVEATFGIKMPSSKQTLLEGRLTRRLRALSFSGFDEYWEYLHSEAGIKNEMIFFTDLVSTHKTDFFREPAHFQFLSERYLPSWTSANPGATLEAWSCGCSSGEEPYTISLVLKHFFSSIGSTSDYRVLGTDISEPVLARGLRAVYTENTAASIPSVYHRYLRRGTKEKEGLVRIGPEARASVRFRVLNLVEKDYGISEKFDFIFFRNVMIYFEKDLQIAILKRLKDRLKSGGLLFVGHSESVFGWDHGMKSVIPTVYQKG
ncbi:MAG: protein-glutamate O-methyltransferase CheR [Spirochaetia bacterium]|nr:protein-glutamate O-methyltransferase CheR [Spirochaetia bacterium]